MARSYANHNNYPFLSRLDVDLDVKQRLSINLANIYSGSDDVIETPLARDNGSKYLIGKWTDLLSINRDRMNQVLYELEESQLSKCGPRSKSIPWTERREGVKQSFEMLDVNYKTLDATPQAIHDRGILRPLTPANALKFLKNDTNSGLPYYTRKSKIKSRLIDKFESLLHRKDPCILFTRTQENGKTRDVWGFPAADTLNEMCYYRPILEYQKKLFWRTALLGPDAVNKRMTYIIEQAKSLGLVIISIDFSNYDRSLKPGLQSEIGYYYKYLFQPKFHDEIDYITERKSTIGLLTPDGITNGPHGEPSGSTFTNEDDSIGQYVIGKKSKALIKDLFEIQGDDGVYAVKEEDVVKLFKTFESYGLEVNESKSNTSKDYAMYLQNLYHSDYKRNGVIGGIYPTYRALNRILYQERWSNFEDYDIKGSDYFAIRAISILENCKFHPLFKELVEFVLKYDKYGLRPSQQGIRNYIRMMENTSGIEGVLFNQYSDNVRGINSFETVKLIRSLN